MSRRSSSADAPVLWPLVQTAHLARRRLEALLAEEGLTGPQFGVLAALADGDDLSSADLARAILVRPQSMAGVVTSVTAKGLAERVGQRGRGRRTTVRLTAPGRELLRRLRPRVAALDAASVTGLDAGRTETMRELLGILAEHLAAATDGADEGVVL